MSASISASDYTSAACDALDIAIVKATQAGLPLVARPYHLVAEQVGATPEAVMVRLGRMQAQGLIRRIGVVPNHYRLGYRGNGMSVWDIPDDRIAGVGRRVGALDYVSHCYHRPRHLPEWRYNLFAMVHGQTRDEVEQKVADIAALLGDDASAHEVLYSTRILKKTGMRFVG